MDTPPPLPPSATTTVRMPGVIKGAIALQIAGIIVSLISTAVLLLDPEKLDAIVAAEPDAPEFVRVAAMIGGVIGGMIAIGLNGLALFGTWRGIHVIRILWTVLAGIGLLMLPLGLLANELMPPGEDMPAMPDMAADPLALAQMAINTVAIVLLWLPAAKPWFAENRQRGPGL